MKKIGSSSRTLTCSSRSRISAISISVPSRGTMSAEDEGAEDEVDADVVGDPG